MSPTQLIEIAQVVAAQHAIIASIWLWFMVDPT